MVADVVGWTVNTMWVNVGTVIKIIYINFQSKCQFIRYKLKIVLFFYDINVSRYYSYHQEDAVHITHHSINP